MEIQLSKAKDKAGQFDVDADQALQLISKFMSIRTQNKCSLIFHASEESSRRKLIVIWEWLLSQRLFDPHIVSEIKQDMIPEITNFQEALTTLGHINMLQAELQTLRNPMTDMEVIICHCQKMSTNPKFAEQFVPIKLKYLQTPLTQTADLPPSFTSTPLPREYQEPRTWASYSSDVALHARAHNSVARTSTVLAATAFSHTSPDRTGHRETWDQSQGWRRRDSRFSNRERERRLQKAQEDVYKKFYKRPSSSSSAKGQVRVASADPAAPDEALTDGEVRALRAAISGWHDDSDGDSSDPGSDV
jgi:hypothetical protein